MPSRKLPTFDMSCGKIDISSHPEYLEQQGFSRYKKKPIVVYAKEMDKPFAVKTLEGVMRGKKGDFLVIGISGEMYPVDREIFFKTYEVLSL